jgi:hypothetical protein
MLFIVSTLISCKKNNVINQSDLLIGKWKVKSIIDVYPDRSVDGFVHSEYYFNFSTNQTYTLQETPSSYYFGPYEFDSQSKLITLKFNGPIIRNYTILTIDDHNLIMTQQLSGRDRQFTLTK